MPRDAQLCLEEIRGAILKIHRYTSGLSFESFCADEKTVDAVVHNLELIGEASKQIPREMRRAQPHVDWLEVAGFHDALQSGECAVDHEIVWDMIHSRLPGLERAVQELSAG